MPYRSPTTLAPDYEQGFLPDWLGGDDPFVVPPELPGVPLPEPPPELPGVPPEVPPEFPQVPPVPPLPAQEEPIDWMPIAIVASAAIAAAVAIFWD
jgi:hypothetical protein